MRRTTTLALAVGLALIAAAPASAHHRADFEVIASDLDNPRHVAVAKNGDVWVAEAGRGAKPEDSNSCFESAEGSACTGDSGAITRIDRHGQKRVVTGLASFAPEEGNSAIGPHGVFADGNDVYFTNGGPTAPWRGDDDTNTILRDQLIVEEAVSQYYGTLRKVTRHGPGRLIADIWDFERDNNPDKLLGNPLIDSNPVDVYADDGRFFVPDAGGNSVLRVGRSGGIRPLAIFPNITMPFPFPPPPETVPMQAVPTGVVKGPDGALYVSQLTGFPFPVGGAKVFRIDSWTGKVTEYAKGITNGMDLAFGRDGTLYVLEIDHDSLLNPTSNAGAILRVPWHRKGSATATPAELPSGLELTEPGGIAVGKRGDLFVSTHSREAGEGQVVRIDLG